jgi:hypothetical protein
MAHIRRQNISFKATKIVSKPTKVSFQTKDGRDVVFKAHKDVPKVIRVEFLAKKNKNK